MIIPNLANLGHPVSTPTLLIRPGFTENSALGQLIGRSSVVGSGLDRRTAFGVGVGISAKGPC
jgi:hypothetical protein